ncbi:MAG: glutamate-5-semialdehyde dehydrogenase, partial [Actinobacteria bacterium]|nr:glutamate-5-semialdehyde dehydrogenase [Actinomycetota bacterium]
MSEQLQSLTAGERIVFGGDRFATVSSQLAAKFVAGDRLVVVHETGDLLHLPAAEHAVAAAAVARAFEAFVALSTVTDDQISDFFGRFSDLLADDLVFASIAAANAADVQQATTRGRATGRLVLAPKMRADMIEGLRTWRDIPTRRSQQMTEVRHDRW